MATPVTLTIYDLFLNSGWWFGYSQKQWPSCNICPVRLWGWSSHGTGILTLHLPQIEAKYKGNSSNPIGHLGFCWVSFQMTPSMFHYLLPVLSPQWCHGGSRSTYTLVTESWATGDLTVGTPGPDLRRKGLVSDTDSSLVALPGWKYGWETKTVGQMIHPSKNEHGT